MAYADRISDLARTLAQYPTSVTITGSKIDIRTAKQLESLNAQISNDQSLARDGDTLIAAGSGKDAKALSQRIADGAPQVGNLLAAFGAQDAERLKTLSIMSKQKFDASAASRLQAEKRFADEVAKLMMQESQAVSALPTSPCGPKPHPTPTPTPSPGPSPSPVPSLDDVIASLPGYLQITIPDAVSGYDADSLAVASKAAGDAAIKLGVKTPDGITDYATVQFTGGPDISNQPWASAILKDTGLGTIDDRIAILNNALQARLLLADAMNDSPSPAPTSR
ncbi:hypothetical protein [Thalassospira sp. A3_1]|uniref:hypothetical protein n=1 Tax=Thalassospira sp. A3_1 TaxID=2821088 RepID=UPI001ADC8A15|nr:hypothetical protein [Thalassospira sp. A3_1]MBO9508289.1 hypothetical protein [Thalassospira sp. A3_1]